MCHSYSNPVRAIVPAVKSYYHVHPWIIVWCLHIKASQSLVAKRSKLYNLSLRFVQLLTYDWQIRRSFVCSIDPSLLTNIRTRHSLRSLESVRG